MLNLNEEKKNKSITDKISEQFLNGLIVLVPPAITFFIVDWLLKITGTTFDKYVGKYLPFYFPGIGLVVIVLAIWITGIVSGHYLPKKIIRFCEFILSKIPVIKFIYSSIKQFSKAIFESNSAFQHVVLVPYHQSLALGFLMSKVPDAVREKIGEDYVCVFVPWSLNMTSGTNLFVKKSDVIHVDMPPEEALKFMLTAGTVSKNDGLPEEK